MLLIIFLVLALLYVQSLLPAKYLIDQTGLVSQMGAPDNLPEPTSKLLRSRKALRNLQETLPIFLTLAVLSIVLGAQGWLSIVGGVVFLLGRLGHVVSHIGGLSPWRTLAYFTALGGLVLLAIPLIPFIWA